MPDDNEPADNTSLDDIDHADALRRSASNLALIVIGLMVVCGGLVWLTRGSQVRWIENIASLLAALCGLAAFGTLCAALLLVFCAFAAETRSRLVHKQFRLSRLWLDDRPVPAAPGRRMLRVFGRLFKHVGLIGVPVAIFVGGLSDAWLLVGYACVGLAMLGYLADAIDGFLDGLNDEDA